MTTSPKIVSEVLEDSFTIYAKRNPNAWHSPVLPSFGGGSKVVGRASIDQNTLYAWVFPVVESTERYTSVAVTPQVATGTVRVGIFSDNSGYPGNLISDFGEITLNTTNTPLSLAIDITLTRGRYWLALISNANTQLYAIGESIGGLGWPPISMYAPFSGYDPTYTFNPPFIHYNTVQVSSTYGPLPSTFPSDGNKYYWECPVYLYKV
jgi:hypothetical protein